VVSRQSDYVVVDITANAFLHHMVRNIVGSLLAVGSRSSSVEWFEMVLQERDRTQAADTAPAEGLYLVDVSYPEAFGLPETPDGPTLLRGQL
jgi:tRNA pseudouridine38-40 synthase